jgi:AhpD family alkylhydroperoxidase
MAMNNIYYRFVHLVGDADYQTMPARLRMNVIGNPGIDEIDFEIYSLAVSAVNGCGLRIEAHEKQLRRHEVSREAIQSAIRIAAVVHAVAATLARRHRRPPPARWPTRPKTLTKLRIRGRRSALILSVPTLTETRPDMSSRAFEKTAYVVVCRDGPQGDAVRAAYTPQHMQYIETVLGDLNVAGPLYDDAAQKPIGSLYCLHTSSLARAREIIRKRSLSSGTRAVRERRIFSASARSGPIHRRQNFGERERPRGRSVGRRAQ